MHSHRATLSFFVLASPTNFLTPLQHDGDGFSPPNALSLPLMKPKHGDSSCATGTQLSTSSFWDRPTIREHTNTATKATPPIVDRRLKIPDMFLLVIYTNTCWVFMFWGGVYDLSAFYIRFLVPFPENLLSCRFCDSFMVVIATQRSGGFSLTVMVEWSKWSELVSCQIAWISVHWLCIVVLFFTWMRRIGKIMRLKLNGKGRDWESFDKQGNCCWLEAIDQYNQHGSNACTQECIWQCLWLSTLQGIWDRSCHWGQAAAGFLQGLPFDMIQWWIHLDHSNGSVPLNQTLLDWPADAELGFLCRPQGHSPTLRSRWNSLVQRHTSKSVEQSPHRWSAILWDHCFPLKFKVTSFNWVSWTLIFLQKYIMNEIFPACMWGDGLTLKCCLSFKTSTHRTHWNSFQRSFPIEIDLKTRIKILRTSKLSASKWSQIFIWISGSISNEIGC